MKVYRNRTTKSGVTHYEPGETWIDVKFVGRTKPYRYRESRIGAGHLREMKRLADAGEGLATYISQHPEVNAGHDP